VFFLANFRQIFFFFNLKLVGRMVMCQISKYFLNGLEMLER